MHDHVWRPFPHRVLYASGCQRNPRWHHRGSERREENPDDDGLNPKEENACVPRVFATITTFADADPKETFEFGDAELLNISNFRL